MEKDFYTTDYFTKYALNYLEEYKDEGKPFFLYVAYNAPHDPLQAWPEDIKKYRGKFMAGYEACRNARYNCPFPTNIGTPPGTRTPNQLIKSQLLCQIELGGLFQ